MHSKNLKPLALTSLCLASAFALAYTSKPCEPADPPSCSGSGNGAQCSSGGQLGHIEISDPQPYAYYYCGGNSNGRCGGPNSSGTCSELLYRTGYASHIQCVQDGDPTVVLHDYGWCFTSMTTAPPVYTGYDCGLSPCPDVPNHYPPNIVGYVAPCNLQVGQYVITDCDNTTLP